MADNNSFSRITQLIRDLSTNQKTALGIGALVLIVAVTIAVSFANTPHYALLYGNLTEEDASTVVEKLKSMKVEYHLLDKGTRIEVPAAKVDETRLALASEGIPLGGNVGFELFDKPQMGQSEFGERLNYLRGLQGELARTISQLESVRSARVHLVLPEHRLYSTEDQKPSASVVLNLHSSQPKSSEVKSIINLVSSAVEGLKPANVTVVDTTGKLLSDMTDYSQEGNNSTRLQAQRTAEARIEARVQNMLDRVLGPNKALTCASVTLNFDRKQVDSEVYTPVANKQGQGVLESEQRSTESYDGSRANPLSAGGAAGATANTTRELLGGNGTPNGGRAYAREDINAKYLVTREKTHTEVSPGQVEKVSLALFVDKSITADQVTGLTDTIKAAAGLVENRDQIVVQSIAFDTSALEAANKETQQQSRTQMLMTIGKYSLGGVMILAFFFFLLSIYRSALAPVTAQILPVEEDLPSYELLSTTSPETAIDQYGSFSSHFTLAEEPATDEEEELLRNLDPERVAHVIKGLMTEES
ncbi:MAG: flagellar basal-body MS-ring/collar protein FliF [Armatimonadota bacterium]